MPPKNRPLQAQELLQLGDDGKLLECAACEKGGDLLRCCSCPHAFHPECAGYAGFKDVPVARSRWQCWYCAGGKGFKHPTSQLAVKVGSKLLVAYTNECQVYYLGEAAEVTRERVVVRYPHFPDSHTERLPRTDKRLWHGTLNGSAWQFDKSDFSYEPLSRCAPVDFVRLRKELAARQAAAAAAAAAPAAGGGAPQAQRVVPTAAAAGAASPGGSRRHGSRHASQHAQQAGAQTRGAASPSTSSQLGSGPPPKKQRIGTKPAAPGAAAAGAAGPNAPRQTAEPPPPQQQEQHVAVAQAQQAKRRLPDAGLPTAAASLVSGSSKRQAEQPSGPPLAGSKASASAKPPAAVQEVGKARQPATAAAAAAGKSMKQVSNSQPANTAKQQQQGGEKQQAAMADQPAKLQQPAPANPPNLQHPKLPAKLQGLQPKTNTGSAAAAPKAGSSSAAEEESSVTEDSSVSDDSSMSEGSSSEDSGISEDSSGSEADSSDESSSSDEEGSSETSGSSNGDTAAKPGDQQPAASEAERTTGPAAPAKQAAVQQPRKPAASPQQRKGIREGGQGSGSSGRSSESSSDGDGSSSDEDGSSSDEDGSSSDEDGSSSDEEGSSSDGEGSTSDEEGSRCNGSDASLQQQHHHQQPLKSTGTEQQQGNAAAAGQQEPAAPALRVNAPASGASRNPQPAMPAHGLRLTHKQPPSAVATAAAAKRPRLGQPSQPPAQGKSPAACKGAEAAVAAAAAIATAAVVAASSSLSPQARLAQRLAAARGEAAALLQQQRQQPYDGAYHLPEDLSDGETAAQPSAKQRSSQLAMQQPSAPAGLQPAGKALQPAGVGVGESQQLAAAAVPAQAVATGASAPQPSASESGRQSVAQAVADAAIAAVLQHLQQDQAAPSEGPRAGQAAQNASSKSKQEQGQPGQQGQQGIGQQASAPGTLPAQPKPQQPASAPAGHQRQAKQAAAGLQQAPPAVQPQPRGPTPPPAAAAVKQRPAAPPPQQQQPMPAVQQAKASSITAGQALVPMPSGSGQPGTASAGTSATSGQLSGSRQPTVPWSQAEEDALLDAVRHLGVGKWQRVKDLKATELSGRSVGEIRAKWRSGLKQQGFVATATAATMAAAPAAAADTAGRESNEAALPVEAKAACAAAAAAALSAAAAAALSAAAAATHWERPSAFSGALTGQLRPTAAALALCAGQLVEVRGVEEDFRGGWALASVLQVHHGGSAGIASVDVEYCDFREEGEATNTRERVSFLHTTDDRRWVFPRIRLPLHPAKPTGTLPSALREKQAVEAFLHDVWWWGELVSVQEQQGVAGVRFEPPPLGEGDLTFHPLANVRPSTTDPGQGMVSLTAEAQPALEQGAAQLLGVPQAAQAVRHVGSGSAGAEPGQAAGLHPAPANAAGLTGGPLPLAAVPPASQSSPAAAALAASGAGPMSAAKRCQATSGLSFTTAQQQHVQPQASQSPLPLQQLLHPQQQRTAAQQQQPSAKDVFSLATRMFKSNVLGRK